MPKITRGGVSNRLVDPDFIAEPGTPVQTAIDEGRPDVGQPSDDEQKRDREAVDEQPKGNDDGETGRDKAKPANETPAFLPKKATPAAKKK